MANVSSIPNPNAIYRARESPPIQIVEEITAISVTDHGSGTYVFDFGVNHAGWPKLSMKGARGTAVIMRPAELLNSDGTITQATTGGPIYDRYTFSGNGTETYMPTFMYAQFFSIAKTESTIFIGITVFGTYK
jgi:alpha-L-rhamnosidase